MSAAKPTPGPCDLWRLAKPWTPEQWSEIVTAAMNARLRRRDANACHEMARLAVKADMGDGSSDREHARMHQCRARAHEARVRYFSEVRLGEIDPAALDAAIAKATGSAA